MDTPFRHTNTTCAESRATSIGWAFVAKAAEAASSNTTPTTRTDLDFMDLKTIEAEKSLQGSVLAQLGRMTAHAWDCDIEPLEAARRTAELEDERCHTRVDL